MGLMEMFKDPSLFVNLDFGDKLAGAGITTLIGMGTTFTILFLLWAIIAIVSKCLNVANKKAVKTKAKTEPAAAAPVAAPAAAAAAPSEDEAQIAAVIAAAIAASEGSTLEAQTDLKIRKIVRTNGSRPAWGAEGLNEVLNSRRMY